MKLKTLIIIGFFICTISGLPAAVSAADPDAYVVTTDYSGNSYYMAFNADGTFDDMVWIGTTPTPSYGNAIGDFDGDGDYDFVVPGGGEPGEPGSIYLFEKLGDGNNFAAPREVGQWDRAYFAGDLAAADFDRDGKDDVVLTYHGSVDCELYLNYNADSGLFTRSRLTGAASMGSIGVDAADVDDDGNIDFIVAPYQRAGQFAINYVNLNNGDGTFTTTTEIFAAGTYDAYYGIAVADFSGNGPVDLLASTYMSIDFYRGSEDGSFGYDPEDRFASGAYAPAPMDNFDVDGDGREDLLVGAVDNGTQVAVFINQGDGSFVPGNVYGGALAPLSAISALPYNPNQPPEALADASVTQAYVGESIQFDGTGSADDDGDIVSYDWDFDDGNVAGGDTPEHSYDAVGTYTVTLTVTDNRGAESSDQIQIEVIEVLSLSATIRIFPRTLNLRSKGKWVTAWIKLPKGYSASDVDPGSICMLDEGSSDPVFAVANSKRGRFHKFRKWSHKKRWLKVKFDRQDVIAAIAAPAGKTVLQVEGYLQPAGKQNQITGKQNQMKFSGSDTIRTFEKQKKYKKSKAKKWFSWRNKRKR